MDVSVCIVNWNTREMLRRCLTSIRTRTTGLAFEVIVVDNASADGSAAMVAAEFPEVRLIASTVNHGFARGSNLAAAVGVGEHVLYLNPDTELVDNAIHDMWACLRRQPDCGAVGCQLLNSDGSIQFTCAGALPTPRNELASLLMLDRLFPASAACSARELAHWDHADSRDVDCLSGACMMLPRALAERLSGFDEALFMYGEDLDLCCRIRRVGLRLHYLAQPRIYHHEGAASGLRGRSFAPLRQRAANYYVLRKNFGRGAAWGYRAAVTLGSVARVAGACAAAPVWAWRCEATRMRCLHFLARHADLLLWSVGLKGGSSR